MIQVFNINKLVIWISTNVTNNDIFSCKLIVNILSAEQNNTNIHLTNRDRDKLTN